MYVCIVAVWGSQQRVPDSTTMVVQAPTSGPGKAGLWVEAWDENEFSDPTLIGVGFVDLAKAVVAGNDGVMEEVPVTRKGKSNGVVKMKLVFTPKKEPAPAPAPAPAPSPAAAPAPTPAAAPAPAPAPARAAAPAPAPSADQPASKPPTKAELAAQKRAAAAEEKKQAADAAAAKKQRKADEKAAFEAKAEEDASRRQLDFDAPHTGDLLVVAETGNFLKDADTFGKMDPCVVVALIRFKHPLE